MDLEEMEKLWEIQDKWKLMAWGMKQKQSLLFRSHFLTATEHLKDKFRIILGRFLQKKANREFEEMEQLIKSLDLGTYEKQNKKQLVGNFKSKAVDVDINNFKLDIIQE